MDVSDQELVRRHLTGDRQAFELLVQRHAGPLYRLARMMLGHESDAHDIVQETFLGALRGMGSFRGDAAVRTWLCRILVRQVARHRRSLRLRRTDALDEASEAHGRAGGEAASDARMDVELLLGRLGHEHRDILLLREVHGLSYDEMAAALQLPRGTVESRLFRARKAFEQLARTGGNAQH